MYFDSSRERWIGAAAAGVNPKNGARRRVKVTGKPRESRSSVAARLRARMVELEEAGRSPETVGELIEAWRTRAAPKRKSESTLTMTDSLIKNHIVPVLGDVKLSKLDVETVEAFLDARAELAKSTLDKIKTILAQSFDFGIRRRPIDWNPARVAELPTNATSTREGRGAPRL